MPQKFRYPFFTEMLWHVLAKYVYTLLGRSHLEGEDGRENEVNDGPHVHLTHYELFGLKVRVGGEVRQATANFTI